MPNTIAMVHNRVLLRRSFSMTCSRRMLLAAFKFIVKHPTTSIPAQEPQSKSCAYLAVKSNWVQCMGAQEAS